MTFPTRLSPQFRYRTDMISQFCSTPAPDSWLAPANKYSYTHLYVKLNAKTETHLIRRITCQLGFDGRIAFYPVRSECEAAWTLPPTGITIKLDISTESLAADRIFGGTLSLSSKPHQVVMFHQEGDPLARRNML